MKLREYAEKINALVEEYGELDLVYSTDNEGNAFHRVLFDPSIGKMGDEDFIQFCTVNDIDHEGLWKPNEKPSVICIN